MKTALIITAILLITIFIYYKLTNKTKERGVTITGKPTRNFGAKASTKKRFLKYYTIRVKYRKVPAIQ